jgi:hypothetical protein
MPLCSLRSISNFGLAWQARMDEREECGHLPHSRAISQGEVSRFHFRWTQMLHDYVAPFSQECVESAFGDPKFSRFG